MAKGKGSPSGGGGVVHVHSYERGTGDVKAYERGLPGSGGVASSAGLPTAAPRAHPAAGLHGSASGHASAGGQRSPGQSSASAALAAARSGQSGDVGMSHVHERRAAAEVSAANRAASQSQRDSRGVPHALSYSEKLERDARESLERWKKSGQMPDTESPKDRAEREAWLRSPEAAAERARTAAENERGDEEAPKRAPSRDAFRGRALEGVGKEELRPGVDSSEVRRAEDVRRGALRFGAGHERLVPGIDSSEIMMEGQKKGYDARRRGDVAVASGVDAARLAAARSPEGRAAASRQHARDERDLERHNAYMEKDFSDAALEAEEGIKTSRAPFSVDRVEQRPGRGEVAVLVSELGEQLDVPRGMLAHDVKPGDVISRAFGVDEARTAELKAATRYAQEHVRSSGSGDIKIK